VSGKNVRGHSARRARPYDDRIVGFGQIYFRLRHERILLAPNGLESLALPGRPERSVDYAKRSPHSVAKMNTRDGIQQWTAFFVQHNLTIGTLER
jgi:hypothetical protein